MTIRIYHNPRCSKSRQSLALLNESGQNPEIVEYLKTPPSREQLSEILSLLGMEPMDLIRKNEKEFKEAGLDNPDLDRDTVIDIMVAYPKLIERPIVVNGNMAVIGRPPERVLEVISGND